MGNHEQIRNSFSELHISQETYQEVLKMRYPITEVYNMVPLGKSQLALYIEEGLLHPAAEFKKHQADGFFSETEVEQIKAVHTLRLREFGLLDIQYLTICKEKANTFLQEKSKEKKVLLAEDQEVLAAVSCLQENAPEGKALEKMRKSLAGKFPDMAGGQTMLQKAMPMIVLTGALFIVLALFLWKLPGLPLKVLAVLSLIGIGGLIATIAAVMYAFKAIAPKKHTYIGKGMILEVTRETGFDSSFAMGQSVVPGAGFSEQGKGGIWQLVFMFWNEIRPDHYFPLIRYNHQGKDRIGTIKNGGWKNTWKAGQELEISWEEKDTGLVALSNNRYLLGKSLTAAVLGILLIGLVSVFLGPVYHLSTLESGGRYVTSLEEVLTGVEEVYEGTLEESEDMIVMEYSCFSGEKEFIFNCQKGDIIAVENSELFGEDGDTVETKCHMNGRRVSSYYPPENGRHVQQFTADADGELHLTVIAYKDAGRITISKKQ